MNFNPSEEEINFVNDALRKFNDEKVGPDNHVLLNIVEYDENKNVIAGLLLKPQNQKQKNEVAILFMLIPCPGRLLSSTKSTATKSLAN